MPTFMATLTLSFTCSPCATEKYDAASETIASARPPSLFRSDLPASLSRRPSDCGSTLGNGADKAPGFPGSGGDVITQRPEIQDPHYPPPSLLDASNRTSLRPHCGRPRRVSILTGSLTTTSSFAGIYHGGRGRVPDQRILRCDKASGKNAACSARAR